MHSNIFTSTAGGHHNVDTDLAFVLLDCRKVIVQFMLFQTSVIDASNSSIFFLRNNIIGPRGTLQLLDKNTWHDPYFFPPKGPNDNNMFTVIV